MNTTSTDSAFGLCSIVGASLSTTTTVDPKCRLILPTQPGLLCVFQTCSLTYCKRCWNIGRHEATRFISAPQAVPQSSSRQGGGAACSTDHSGCSVCLLSSLSTNGVFQIKKLNENLRIHGTHAQAVTCLGTCPVSKACCSAGSNSMRCSSGHCLDEGDESTATCEFGEVTHPRHSMCGTQHVAA